MAVVSLMAVDLEMAAVGEVEMAVEMFPLVFFFLLQPSWGRAEDNPKPVCAALQNRVFAQCFNGLGKSFGALQLTQANLSGSNFSFASISSWSIDGLKVFSGRWKETLISRSAVENSRWTDLDLRGSVISRSQWKNLDVDSSNLSGLKIDRSHFLGCSFRQVEMKGLAITDSVFEDCVFPKNFKKEAVLINVQFRNCRFE